MTLLKMYLAILADNSVHDYPFARCWHDDRLFMLTDLWRAVFFVGKEQASQSEVDAFSNVVFPGFAYPCLTPM